MPGFWSRLLLAPRSWETALFILVAVVLGLTYLTVRPPLNTPDARAHATRIIHLAEGSLLPERLGEGRYGGVLSAPLVVSSDRLLTGRPPPRSVGDPARHDGAD